MHQLKQQEEFEKYKKIKLLGEGSFGKAYLIERMSDRLMCVMKTIDIQRMGEQEKKETLQEAKIIEHLQHPNIVKFIEVFKTKKGKLCIVMDYADGGDLAGKMKEQRGRYFSEPQILDWFTQMCLGMKHCHDRKIIHRDLKGANVFLTKKGIVKIGDFGIAKVLSHTIQKAKTMVGTPYYLSPEIVQSKPYNSKTDIWSMGVMLYELCALKPPFDGTSIPMLTMKIVRGVYSPIPSTYSAEMKNLIKQMLEIDTNRRPDVNKILSMPFIQKRIQGFLNETVMKDEFSHTVLHKQNVFQHKPANADALKQKAEKARLERLALDRRAEEKKKQEAAKGNRAEEYAALMNNNNKPPPAKDPVAERRQQNAANYLNAGGYKPPNNQPAYKQYQPTNPKYGVSPGMAAAMGQGGNRAHTPQMGREPAPVAQYGYKGAAGNPPQQNYHYRNPSGGDRGAGAAADYQQQHQKKRAAELEAQNAYRQKMADLDKDKQELKQKAAMDNAARERRALEAKQILDAQKVQREQKNRDIDRRLRDREDEIKRKEEEMLEKKRNQDQQMKAMDKRSKEQQEKRQLEEARRDYQERVRNQMRAQKLREEAERKSNLAMEEQRVIRDKQEGISRRIQEEHQQKRDLQERIKKEEEARKATEQQKAAAEAKKRQAQRELSEARKKKEKQKQLDRDNDPVLKDYQRKKEQEQKRQEIESQLKQEREKQRQKEYGADARAKYKAEALAQLAKLEQQKVKEKEKPKQKEQKPDSTIMRICNNAQDQILNIEQKMLAQQQQQRNAPTPPWEKQKVEEEQKYEPKDNLVNAHQVNKAAVEREAKKKAMEEQRRQMRSDMQKKAGQKQDPVFLEVNGEPEQPAREFKISPKKKNVLKSARQNSANRENSANRREPQTPQQQPSKVLKSQRPQTGSNVAKSAHKPPASKRNVNPEWNADAYDPNAYQNNENQMQVIGQGRPRSENRRLPNVKQPAPRAQEVKRDPSEKNLPQIDSSRGGAAQQQKDNQEADMFDMNNGNFEEYDIDQRESEQTNEVYQMYEEMMNLVQKGMKNMNDGDSSDASDNTANTPKEKKAKVGNHKKESPRVEKQYKEKIEDAKDREDFSDSDSDEEIGRGDDSSPILKPSNKLFNQRDGKYQPKMTEVVEETEPESSFKETDRFKKKPLKGRKQSDVPTTIRESDEFNGNQDREDDFSEESEDEQVKSAKNMLKDQSFTAARGPVNNGLTFVGGANPAPNDDTSKLSSVEQIREYLEQEIDINILKQVYPIIKSFGDDILFVDKMSDLKSQLSHLLSSEQVDRYHQSFATLVFYELEIEKANTFKKSLPKDQQNQEPDYDPAGMMNAINCFKDVKATACFGKMTIGKRY